MIRDLLHTLRSGTTNGDRPILTFMLGLLVVSVSLIVYGLVK